MRFPFSVMRMKGIRIQSIVKELNNEKIDIINWNNEPEIFIMRALSPAKPVKVIIDEENMKAVAVIPDEQISLAIGKGGQNKRLASRLTNYEIDIIKESEYEDIISEEVSDQLRLHVHLRNAWRDAAGVAQDLPLYNEELPREEDAVPRHERANTHAWNEDVGRRRADGSRRRLDGLETAPLPCCAEF